MYDGHDRRCAKGLLCNTALHQFKGGNLRGGGVSKLIVSTFSTWEPWNSSVVPRWSSRFQRQAAQVGTDFITRISALISLPCPVF